MDPANFFFFYLGLFIPQLAKKLRDKSTAKGKEYTTEKLKDVVEKLTRREIWEKKLGDLKTKEWKELFQSVLVSSIQQTYNDWGKDEIRILVSDLVKAVKEEISSINDNQVIIQKIEELNTLNIASYELLRVISQLMLSTTENQSTQDTVLKGLTEELMNAHTDNIIKKILSAIERVSMTDEKLHSMISKRLEKLDKEFRQFFEKFSKNYVILPKSPYDSNVFPTLIRPPSLDPEMMALKIDYPIDLTFEYPLLDIVGVMIITRSGAPYYTQFYEPIHGEPELLTALLQTVFNSLHPTLPSQKILDRGQTSELGLSYEGSVHGVNIRIIQSPTSGLSIALMMKKQHEIIGDPYWEKFQGPLKGLLFEIETQLLPMIQQWLGQPLSREEQAKVHTLIVRNLRTALLFPIVIPTSQIEDISTRSLEMHTSVKTSLERLGRQYRHSLLLSHVWDMITNFYSKTEIPKKLQMFLDHHIVQPRYPNLFRFPLRESKTEFSVQEELWKDRILKSVSHETEGHKTVSEEQFQPFLSDDVSQYSKQAIGLILIHEVLYSVKTVLEALIEQGIAIDLLPNENLGFKVGFHHLKRIEYFEADLRDIKQSMLDQYSQKEILLNKNKILITKDTFKTSDDSIAFSWIKGVFKIGMSLYSVRELFRKLLEQGISITSTNQELRIGFKIIKKSKYIKQHLISIKEKNNPNQLAIYHKGLFLLLENENPLSEIKEMLFGRTQCKQCGATLSKYAFFCNKCGSHL